MYITLTNPTLFFHPYKAVGEFLFYLFFINQRKSEYESCIDIESYILTQARIISLNAYRTQHEIIGCPQGSSPQIIADKNMGKLAGFLAILSQSGKIELSFHPIAETELTSHHIAIQQMDMLRTLPCHLPRQIVTVSYSTCIILINGWYGTAKQEAALEFRKQIESGIETYGTFSLKSSLAKRITIGIMYSVIRMQNALNLNAAATGREIAAVVSIHHNRCKVVQKMV